MNGDSIFRESDEWRDYRQRLSKFVASPESAMIMDADREWRSRNNGDSGARSAFKLLSGQVVKRFVTIWELFDHREEFEECLEMLTKKALEIRARVRFSRIVTATPSARELAYSLFARIQERGFDPELNVSHFGTDWTKGFLKNGSTSLKDQVVLILADVVNSGYLIHAMSEVIAKNGGTVKSVLCVVITNPEWIAYQQSEGVPHRFDSKNLKARLHSVAEFGISPLDPDEYDEAKIIPIDYNAVLPEQRHVSSLHYARAFPISLTFQHLEAAEAIDFASFEIDDHRFSCAMVLPRLLKRFEQDIWKHISRPIVDAARRAREEASAGDPSDKLLLVTTHKREDLLFKNYIADCLEKEGYGTSCAITLKRGVTDSPHLGLSLGAQGVDVKGKEVVLALATLSTQEKLRSIVSLLVEGQVKKITVVCLLNRMGPFTTSFIKAIERFTKRVTVDVTSTSGVVSFTDFEFLMVYSFLDLREVDLAAVTSELDWLFSGFRGRTKVASFVRVSERMESYFAPTMYTPREYCASPYAPLSQLYELTPEQEPIVVSTQEGKIALMTYHFALNKCFGPIAKELLRTTDRRTFIHLYRLMLSDIHHLRFKGDLVRLRVALNKRLEFTQEKMFALETNAPDGMSAEHAEQLKNEVADLVNVQVYLIFGLGIIAHYDCQEQTVELEKRIPDLLFCRKKPQEWIDRFPISLNAYFGEERIFFAFAFLLHGRYPEFNRKRTASQVKASLNQALADFKACFKDRVENPEKHEPGSKARARLIINNLELLLTETGKHDELEKHQLIRYLHREVLRPKEGHNPIFTTLRHLLQAMADVLSTQPATNDQTTFELDKELFTRLDEALSATSSLHMICQATRQLFYFTPTLPEHQERYTALVGQDGFASDCDELIRALHDVRQRRRFSETDRERLQRIVTKLRSDFFDPSSHLRLTLQSYIMRLDEILEQALVHANEELNKEGFQNLFEPRLDELRLDSKTGKCDWPVLCDRHLLRESLRNLMFNLRHSFPEHTRLGLGSDHVQIEVRKERFVPRPEMHEKTGLAFWLRAKGKPPDESSYLTAENTIADQLLRIQALGGDWEFLTEEDGSGFSFGLKLLTRFGFESRSQDGSPEVIGQIREESMLDDQV